MRPRDEGEPFVVHARWDGPAGYQAWLEAPIRAELAAGIGPYVAGELIGRLYDEVL